MNKAAIEATSITTGMRGNILQMVTTKENEVLFIIKATEDTM